MLAARSAALAAMLSLAGCATLQPPVLTGAPGVQTWEGRFAATVTPADGGSPQRNTGRFSLSATAGATELELLSPLGATVLRARVDPQGATMSTADGKRWQAASAQALTEQAIGWRVPVDSLPAWLRGRVRETLRSAPGPDGTERLAVGREDGWEIGIDQWGAQRPQRLTLSWPAPGAEPAPALPGAASPPAAVQLRLIFDDPG